MHGNSLIPTAEEHDRYWDCEQEVVSEYQESFDYLVDHLDIESDLAELIAGDHSRYEIEMMAAGELDALIRREYTEEGD